MIVECSMQGTWGKASKTSEKASITSMKASMYFLEVFTSMEALVEAFVNACVEVILWKMYNLRYLP